MTPSTELSASRATPGKPLHRLIDFELPVGPAKIVGPFIAAFFLTLVCLTIPPAALDLDADPAWCGVLTYAHQHHLQFGTEIVFTFGPFGFLIAPYYFGQPTGLIISVNFLISFLITLGICLLAWRLNRWWRALLILCFFLLFGNIDPRADLAFNLGFFSWGLICLLETGRGLWCAAFALAALAAFGAMAKMTYLFIGGFTMFAVIADFVVRRKWRRALTLPLAFVLLLALGWLAAGQKFANIGQYFLNGFLISRDYDQAAGMEGLSTLRAQGFWVLVLAACAIIPRAAFAFPPTESNYRFRKVIVVLWTSGLLFVFWKHGFVRVDRFHVVNLLGFVPFAAFLADAIPIARSHVRRFTRLAALIASVVVMLALTQLFFGTVTETIAQSIHRVVYHAKCIFVPGYYAKEMSTAMDAFRREAKWPKMSKVIGNATVDVFGTFQAFALLNNLNYHPRPVFQSYAAYSPRLAQLNRDLYLSDRSPEFVVFRLFAHDRRVPTLNDGPSMRELLLNYEPVEQEGVFILLKSKGRIPSRLTLLKHGQVKPGELVSFSEWPTQDLWLEMDLRPSFLGRLNQFLYRPPPVRLSIWNASKTARLERRRVGTPVLSIGGIASPFLFENEDVLKMYSGQPTRAGAYSIDLPTEDLKFWANEIPYRIFKIEPSLTHNPPTNTSAINP